MTKLEPCPFCGSKDPCFAHVVSYWIECVCCEVTGPKTETQENAIKLWNSRSIPPSKRTIRALNIIKDFEDGRGIDWCNVETVFDVVKPLLQKELKGE